MRKARAAMTNFTEAKNVKELARILRLSKGEATRVEMRTDLVVAIKKTRVRAESKSRKTFIYEGFGFPVKFKNVILIKVRGVWTPKVDYERTSKDLLRALAQKPARLTGCEVRFIRLEFEMTLQEFAKRFGVSHVAVLKWEKTKNHPTAMSWMEKDLRLFVLHKLGASEKEIGAVYGSMDEVPAAKGSGIVILRAA
jgi:DNA-binding XRE family transcriptional regulator